MIVVKKSEQYEFSDTLKDLQVSGYVTINNDGFSLELYREKSRIYYTISGDTQNVNIEMPESGLTLQESVDYLNTVIEYVTNTIIDKVVTTKDSE